LKVALERNRGDFSRGEAARLGLSQCRDRDGHSQQNSEDRMEGQSIHRACSSLST
jgi:hypothetical protein